MDVSKKVKVQILNAFVDREKGGNPAGVVLNADGLTNAQKLKIAQAVGLSETAFVSKSTIAAFKLDFFTPTRQIAHCGHATIATFSYLKQIHEVQNGTSSKETIDGIREIIVVDDLAFMEQKAPVFNGVSGYEAKIVQSLGLMNEDIPADYPIKTVNTGNSFVIIPVKNEKLLQMIQPDFDLISEISEKLDIIGYYVFAIKADLKDRDATTRMFAPRYGIKEEAGTGMAAGPLACYIHDILNIQKDRYLIQQGHYMETPSPSLILVDLIRDGGKIQKIMAGGKGILTNSFEVEL